MTSSYRAPLEWLLVYGTRVIAVTDNQLSEELLHR